MLILSPHLDDEVYGCSSFLKEKGLKVFYFTTLHPLCPNDENIRDNKKLVTSLGFKALYSKWGDMTNELEAIGLDIIINSLESLINEHKPDTVLIPAPSYNQDHRIVYDASLTALRPHFSNHFVKKILVYEQPETFGTMREPEPIRPTYFRELDITFKLAMMEIYKSMNRSHRSFEHIEAIARLRGMQSNMDYAEAFEVLRWID